MALFVPENCPRNSKRGLFVTFNDNLYLRNRKLPLRSSRLRLSKLPRVSYRAVTYPAVTYCDVGECYPVVTYGYVCYTDVAVAYRLVTYCDVGEGTAPRFLREGNLRCRMTSGNVTKDTLSGLDTGPDPGRIVGVKGKERKEPR